ncbi:Uncharacterised protein [Vibrio cholerae]|nr:Uncharacterised protein [Vibrio cholerae]
MERISQHCVFESLFPEAQSHCVCTGQQCHAWQPNHLGHHPLALSLAFASVFALTNCLPQTTLLVP